MLGRLYKFRYISRYREIATILGKHGFGFLFDNIGIFKLITYRRAKRANQEVVYLSRPQRLRMALEELGPTFIKLGQLMSVRPDLIPAAYIIELEKLQNNVPPFTFKQVRELCYENGIDIDRDFMSFEPQPLAAASIAQVHRAQLNDGRAVAVKVQRPDIEKIVRTDLAILMEISEILEKRTDWASFYRVRDIVQELGQAVNSELDFVSEANNIETFRRNFAGDNNIKIPAVIPEFSSRKVLTMEYLEGIKISDFEALKKAKFDRKKIVDKLVDIQYKQIYEHGFFHADPHPGNLAIADDESIIFYDFGQMGDIDNILKDHCIDLLTSMVRYDVNGVTRSLLNIGSETQHINREELRRDVSRLQKKYYGMPLSNINVGEAISELLELLIRYKVRIPAELSLLAKMLITIEGIITLLDPDISIVDIAEPYGRKAVLKRFTPKNLKSDFENMVLDYSRAVKEFPRSLETLVHLLGEGEFKIRMEHLNMPKTTARLDIMFNRLALSIIIGSLVIGTALIVNNHQKIILFGAIPLVELGFVVAIVLGLVLVYSIMKSGKY